MSGDRHLRNYFGFSCFLFHMLYMNPIPFFNMHIMLYILPFQDTQVPPSYFIVFCSEFALPQMAVVWHRKRDL